MIHFNPICHTQEFRLLLRNRRRRGGAFGSPEGEGHQRKRKHESPSDLRRRAKRVGIEPLAARRAKSESKFTQAQMRGQVTAKV